MQKQSFPLWNEAMEMKNLPRAGNDLFIALDIDGTILRHDTTISPRVFDALRMHQDLGSRIVLASGRGVYALQVAAQKCGITSGFAVCSNGAITVALGDEATSASVDSWRIMGSGMASDMYLGSTGKMGAIGDETEREARQGVRMFDDGFGLPYRILSVHTFDISRELALLNSALPESYIAVERIDEPRLVSKSFPSGELAGPYEVVPVEKLFLPDATRLTIRPFDMSADELQEVVTSLGLHTVEYAIGYSAWLDISPRGVSKGQALEDIRRGLGIASDFCLAVGDGLNDIEMLEWAGMGVAMGGARDAVKEKANGVCARVEDDGLADVLEYLL
ncbi:MAG: HAD hydrolase family protein [Actinomycetaceae bacterium]|nr:HAD hydrolase family protein [Actinomycetaceae bacterium]